MGGETAVFGPVRTDRPLSLGLAGGTVTSIAAVIGYVLVPALIGGASGVVDAAVTAAVGFVGLPPVHHVAILTAPPFVSAFAATLAVRRAGLCGRGVDARILSGIVFLPMAAACLLYLVTAIGYGATFASGGGHSLASRALLAVALTFWSLLFGLLFLVLVLAVVFVLGLVGAVGGYLLARAVDASGPADGERSESD